MAATSRSSASTSSASGGSSALSIDSPSRSRVRGVRRSWLIPDSIWLRWSFWWSSLLILLGKTARYLLVILLSDLLV